MGEEWARSDAWVATALAMASTDGAADLSHVIGAADTLNHAILRHDEVEQAVRRLLGARLLLLEGDRFVLSAKGAAATASVRGGLFSQVDGVLKRLSRIPVIEEDWTLDPATFRAAIEDYRHRWG